MKILGWVLGILGVLNVFKAIMIFSSAPPEFQHQGVVSLLIGSGLVICSIYAFKRVKKIAQKKEEKDKWNGTNNE
ncbi:MAG: hypothetical protein RR061_00370 [Muribaculaceae bacterium]